MATSPEPTVPRKRIVTYGKAGRRRVSVYGLSSLPRNAPAPQLESQPKFQPTTATAASVNPTKPSLIRQKPTSRAASSISLPSRDVFSPPSIEDEAPRATRKAVARRPTNNKKPKSVRQKPKADTPSPAATAGVDIFDVPMSDDEAPKPSEKAAAPRSSNTKNPKLTQQRLAEEAPLSAAQTPVDVFDVPDSEGEISKLARPIKTPLVASSRKPKPLQQKPLSNTPSPASTEEVDIFDLTSSNAEAPLPIFNLARKTRHISGIKTFSGTSNISRPAPAEVEETESRKRVKLSPLNKASNNKIVSLTVARPSRSRATSHPPQHRPYKSQSDARPIKVAARPRLQASFRKSVPPETPQKQTAVQNEYGTPSPPFSDTDLMDIDPPRDYITPRGMKLFEGLLDSAEAGINELVPKSGMNALRSKVNGSPVKGRVIEQSYSQPVEVSKKSRNFIQHVPRRRLIDSLVEQEDSDDDGDDDSEEETVMVVDSPDSPNLGKQNASGSMIPDVLPVSVTLSDSQSSQTMGTKITYSRQRSMLAEADFMSELVLGMPAPPLQSSLRRRARRGSVPKLQPLQSFHEEVEDVDTTVTAVQSVHELRQAGSVNRFLDEIQDFLDRIGKPGTQLSMRRSGLLDLWSKIQDKNFARQFRANGVEQQLFVHLGQETDIVSAFILVSLLIYILVDNNMPHIVVHLRRQGITRLIIRLLDCQSSIMAVGKERKINMSKIAQSLLSEHHEKFLQMPIWENLQPQAISPRTAALKCLELMVRQTREAGNSGDIFSKELTTNLFAILKSTSDELSWKLPQEKQAIDFYLSLSALEFHSITARTIHDESIWINDYLPIIASTMETALSRPLEDFGVLQLLILRLTLNVTNNNPSASDIFARPSLMSAMGRVIVARFGQISRFLTEEEFSVALDHLILLLGVMINFAEWSSSARQCFQSLEGENNDPLDAMTQTYMENQERASTAASLEEEGRKYVVFGYLSVLLGYMSLLPEISRRIQDKQPGKTLKPLLASIQEFIGYHKTVDSLAADEDGYSRQSGLTERLEILVKKLEAT